MNPRAGEQWHITIDPQPGAVPAAVRVRRWLKLGLRSFGLRCTALETPAEIPLG